jgi:ABC-type phosphate/phosphonate transport system ATPase subunit
MNYDQEIEMFGTTLGVVEANIENASNINMRLMGMLSDVQMLMQQGSIVEANQLINRVKYYFAEYTDTRNSVFAADKVN